MATWSTADAAALAAPQQVRVATRRPDGTLRATRTIWIVADGERLFVRSTNGRGADWFRAAVATGSGQIQAEGATHDDDGPRSATLEVHPRLTHPPATDRNPPVRGTIIYGTRDIRVQDRPTRPSSSLPTPSCARSRPACAGRTCGATAASRRSRRRRRSVTSTSGSRRSSAPTSPRSVPVSSSSAGSSPATTPARTAGRAPLQLPAPHRLRRLPGRADPCPERGRHAARHPRAPGRGPDAQPAGPVRRDVHRLARRRVRRRPPGTHRRRRG
jgi:Uncharacterized protein conserved in bacteria (DUF2255)